MFQPEWAWTSRFDKVCPVIVFDFKVHAHTICEVYQSIEQLTDANEWLKYAWLARFSRCPEFLPHEPARVVIVDDNKHPERGYWRHEICRELELAEYKGNRGLKPDSTPKQTLEHEQRVARISKICQMGLTVAESLGISVFSKEGFEADDWAGVIYRIRRAGLSVDRQVILSTVDTDWHQLVDDKLGIAWANTKWFQPKFRGEADVLSHTHKTFKEPIEHPSQLAQLKAKYGDNSDHLKVGSPVSLYDLTEANPRFYLEGCPAYEKLVSELNNEQPNRPIETYKEAQQWFQLHNIPSAV